MNKTHEVHNLHNDGLLSIATGRRRTETQWRNHEMLWSDLLDKLSVTTRTRETFAQYKKMTRDEQAEIKDVGGFVGGVLKGGRRKAGQVAWRSLLTLDADFATGGLWDDVKMLFGNAIAVYSTHSHSPEKPRLRLIAPLRRMVTPDEYEALSRFVAAEIGIELFDDSTYEPERLMFWPSTAEDGEYVFDYIDGAWLDPDEVFAKRPLWHDASTWPESSRANKAREKHADKQGDPREKPGVIGAFCRTYSVTAAIEEFLPEVYIKCDMPNRYTYAAGTAAAGLVVYDSDLFAYSHHGTDPAGGMLCNAFDLVRIHKYGMRDEDSKPDTPINKLPSYKAMTETAVKLDAVRIELAGAKTVQAREEFGKTDKDWRAELEYSDKGGLRQTINNAVIIMRGDPELRGCVGYDAFMRRVMLRQSVPWREIKEPTPWIDIDDSGLRHYLEKQYGLKGRETIADATAIVMEEHSYHPVKEYLDGLNWDGVPRIDTALIDYMGAEDSVYVRAAMRKWMIAGAARVRNPGCKFDYMLILAGPQGIGKSQFFNRIATRQVWFSDSISKVDNTKDSMEQLAGKWIIEIGELSGMKRADVEHVKVFLSKQEDSYRPSYGRRLESFPRQCVFAGTTNRDDFLQDTTGNRRFWPVAVGDTSKLWEGLTCAVIDQMWAEADFLYCLGEDLYLSGEAGEDAYNAQEVFTESGGKIGAAEDFLERELPENWDNLSINDKKCWLNGASFDDGPGVKKRESISGIELYCECFNGKLEDYRKIDAYEMTDIMNKLGWIRQKKTVRIKEYGKQRIFVNRK